jgi:sugar phosphate isomerase/epimerase
MRDLSGDHRRLSINTATVRQWPLDRIIEECHRRDIRAISPWRDQVLVGVAVDVYHVWWDPKLQAQIDRAGRARLLAFHVCDWLVPTRDLLNDRGMMGDGVIDIPQIRGGMEAAGYDGFNEVEIFSSENWGKRDGDDVLDTCIERHASAV